MSAGYGIGEVQWKMFVRISVALSMRLVLIVIVVSPVLSCGYGSAVSAVVVKIVSVIRLIY